MSSEGGAEIVDDPKENCIDGDILADLVAIREQIGAREAFSKYVPLPDARYVLQVMPQGSNRLMVTMFQEGASTLSLQFYVNAEDGQYQSQAPSPEQMTLLRAALTEVKTPLRHPIDLGENL